MVKLSASFTGMEDIIKVVVSGDPVLSGNLTGLTFASKYGSVSEIFFPDAYLFSFLFLTDLLQPTAGKSKDAANKPAAAFRKALFARLPDK